MKARDVAYTAACGKLQTTLLATPVLKEVPGTELDKVFTDRHTFVADLRSMLSGIPLGTREQKVAELELRALDQDCDAFQQVLIGSRLFRTLNELIGFVSAGTTRDSFMAENFAFTERNLIAPGKKIMLWAHSGHLSRRPAYDLDSSPDITPNGATVYPFGVSLAHWYGGDYHVTNITAGGGTTRGTDGTNADVKGMRPVPFLVKPDSVEGLIASAGANGIAFFRTGGLPMQEMMINYLSMNTEFTSREGSGLIRGTVSDFDSHIFILIGKASTDLKP